MRCRRESYHGSRRRDGPPVPRDPSVAGRSDVADVPARNGRAHLRDIEVRMMGWDKTTREADVARATAARRLAALHVRLERSED